MKLYSVCGKGALRLLLQCSQGDSIQIVMASPEKTVNIVDTAGNGNLKR